MKHFYVSAIDGSKRFLVAGPYPTHQDALDKVQDTLKKADSLDPRAWFMSWGTASNDKETKTPMGVI